MASKRKAIRILAFDISLSCTGIAVIEIKDGKATVIDAGSVATNPKESYAKRTRHIEAYANIFIRKHAKKGYDHVLREKYAGKFGHHSIFSAWNAIDRAMDELGLSDTSDPISANTIKKVVGGHGRADKDQVEAGVRKLIENNDVEIANDNESDAIAVGLCFAIENKLIDNE